MRARLHEIRQEEAASGSYSPITHLSRLFGSRLTGSHLKPGDIDLQTELLRREEEQRNSPVPITKYDQGAQAELLGYVMPSVRQGVRQETTPPAPTTPSTDDISEAALRGRLADLVMPSRQAPSKPATPTPSEVPLSQRLHEYAMPGRR